MKQMTYGKIQNQQKTEEADQNISQQLTANLAAVTLVAATHTAIRNLEILEAILNYKLKPNKQRQQLDRRETEIN